MTKEDFEAYLYLFEKIFPKKATETTILKTKKFLEEYYDSELEGKSYNFRKTIDRNLNYVKDIRNATVEKVYNPKPDSLNVFVNYYLAKSSSDLLKDRGVTEVSLAEFREEFKEEIRAYTRENPLSEEVLDILFAKLPEKLVGIENRISKIEDFIASKDGFIENLFSKPENLGDLGATYSSQKLSLDFLNFLQHELLETKKQYQRAKLLYKNLGSFGLFLIPLKYAIDEERNILKDFFGEELGLNDDLWDDII